MLVGMIAAVNKPAKWNAHAKKILPTSYDEEIEATPWAD